MIDLHHLVNNIELYQEGYRKKGLKVNLNKLVYLEQKLRILQTDTEKVRSICNKLCEEVPKYRNQDKEISNLLKQIDTLNFLANKNKLKAEQTLKTINKKLKKLHNLPDFYNNFHKQLSSGKNETNIVEVLNKTFNIQNISSTKTTINKYLKTLSNFCLETDFSPIIMKCKNGYTILCDEESLEKTISTILDFLCKNSMLVIQVNCKKLHFSNSASYFVRINKHKTIYFEVIRQYKTREFSIKYKDKKTDSTKFVNQLNLLTKW